MKPTQPSGECDLNTFLYDVGSMKVGDKPVLKTGALFHVSSPAFIQCTRASVQFMSRVGIKFLKIQSGGHAITLLRAEFLFFAEV